MGRKGVSKRKVSQTKSKPMPGDKADGSSVASIVKASESHSVKSLDTDKAAVKPASDPKKKARKG
jgi:hypothetical protein